MTNRGLVGLITACLAAWVSASGPASGETLLERGTYLMKGIVACGNCHTIQTPKGPKSGMELAGGLTIKDAGFTVVTPNITPDKETGIGNWTDAQIIASIREGRRPDGSIIGPPMPFRFYRRLSDRDVKAIVAYLRALKPVRNKVAKNTYKFPLPKSYGPPVESVPEVPRTDKVAYGGYLAGPAGHCIECHSPPNKMGMPDVENRPGAGGFPFYGPWGVNVSRNITPDPNHGIGRWTDAQIKRAITQGIGEDGRRLGPPMGYYYYRTIRPDDLASIVAYLRTLKPLPNPN